MRSHDVSIPVASLSVGASPSIGASPFVVASGLGRTRLADERQTLVSCEQCPRLRDYCDRIAREKRRAFRHET